jgi:CelD/BcsL family acetyltransferase involved in cellulose biosynthesis
MAAFDVRLLSGFDDPSLASEPWDRLLHTGDSDVVFLTRHWQEAWWECFGRGRLLLIAVERKGKLAALAPLFSEAGMVFFVGSGGSDYLDFVGDIGDPAVLAAILDIARLQTPDFVGFRFYHVPDSSHTGRRLQAVAGRLGLDCFDEGDLPAPALALAAQPETAQAAVARKSLVRHERFFQREGGLEVEHLRRGAAILPHLEELFAQHMARWQGTPHPSLFHQPAQREFYRRVAALAGDTGWLRFTRLIWQGRTIACHFGFNYRGSYLWYKPAFDIDLARRSPGEALLRQLLLAAIEEGAHTFDFGLGDELFKRRFATQVATVRTWGLYPAEALADPSERRSSR